MRLPHAGACQIAALTDDCLSIIFACLVCGPASKVMFAVIPFVCKRWQAVAQSCVTAVAKAEYGELSNDAPSLVSKRRSLQNFLQKYAGALQTLQLTLNLGAQECSLCGAKRCACAYNALEPSPRSAISPSSPCGHTSIHR